MCFWRWMKMSTDGQVNADCHPSACSGKRKQPSELEGENNAPKPQPAPENNSKLYHALLALTKANSEATKNDNASKKNKTATLWSKGTGYGHDGSTYSWDVNSFQYAKADVPVQKVRLCSHSH